VRQLNEGPELVYLRDAKTTVTWLMWVRGASLRATYVSSSPLSSSFRMRERVRFRRSSATSDQTEPPSRHSLLRGPRGSK